MEKNKISSVSVPISYEGDKKWFVLNHFDNSGQVRAAHISKVRQVHEKDSHHCSEVSVKTSIRYHPKRWKIL